MSKKFYKSFDFKAADKLIKLALKEDSGRGDITSEILIPENKISKAEILVKENGVIAGLEIFKRVFKIVDKNVKAAFTFRDGDDVKKRDVAGYVMGSSRSLLKAERVALNILQHMSGIATKTAKFIKLLNNENIKIIDTRKTTPNLRIFEKAAVRMGGGENHRFGLYDMMLIKDNHIHAHGCIENTLNILKRKRKKVRVKVEIEVKDLDELKIVSEKGVDVIDIIMLDNFKVSDVKKAIKIINEKFKIEISGGINESSIKKYSEIMGIDFISVGALTHSINAMDISLEFTK